MFIFSEFLSTVWIKIKHHVVSIYSLTTFCLTINHCRCLWRCKWHFTWQKTKELNIKVLSTIVASEPLSPSSLFPLKLRTARTISWYTLWPKIFLHIGLVIKLAFFPTGGLSISPSLGGSVARANAPRVSMIKLTQSNWTAVSGAAPENKEENLISVHLKQIEVTTLQWKTKLL